MERQRKRTVCPACGSANSPKWESCARCGESLREAAASVPKKSPKPSPVAEKRGTRGLLVPVLGVAIAGLAVVMLIRSGKGLPEQRVDPAIFTLGTTPSPPPQPTPVIPAGAGQSAYVEGRRLLTAGKASEALAPLAQAVADAPDVAEYRLAYAQALFGVKRNDEAVHQATEAARLGSQFRLDVARLFVHEGQTREAIPVFQTLLETDPNNFDVLREAGAAFGAIQDNTRAVALLRRAAELRPTHAEAQRGLGWALEKAGDTSGAMAAYARTLELEPRSVSARGRLAEMLFQGGKKEDAVSLYREGIERSPAAPALHRGLGGILEQMGRAKEAALEYRVYTRLAPAAGDSKGFAERADRLDPPASGS